MIGTDELIRYIRILLGADRGYAAQVRVPEAGLSLEVTLIRLCRPQMEQGPDALLARLKALEDEVEALRTAPPAPAGPVGPSRASAREEEARRPAPELPRALSEDVKAVASDFRSIATGRVPPCCAAILRKRI